MSTREAIDTITGYFYQFDKTILEILQQENNDVSVYIEGIEDIDIVKADETSAIQCKYYAKTEYNHSVIKKPLILMLEHFAKNRNGKTKYHLYGHYKSGHEKLSTLSCDNLKSDFLTYTKKSKDSNGNKNTVTHFVYNELSLTDIDLQEFLNLLTVDINAPSIEKQYQEIIRLISDELNVSESESGLFHYNSALKVIKKLSTEQNRLKRNITKAEFIKLISIKDEIFDIWFLKRKGRDKYIKSVKKEYLSSGLNMEAFNRFFLVECNLNDELSKIKEVILLLAKKWSKISKRQNPCFCPSIYIHGLSLDNLVKLKNEIYTEGSYFLDPYPFKGSTFSSKHFYTNPTVENGVKFKFVESIFDLEKLIESSGSTVEIYQFFREKQFFTHKKNKHIKIKVEDISYVRDLTK